MKTDRNIIEALLKLSSKRPALTQDLAVVTHYLQNKDDAPDNPYRAEAQDILKSWSSDDEILRTLFVDDNDALAPNERPVEDVEAAISQAVAMAPYAPVSDPRFTFIDLFAGIGGFRVSMQSLGGHCSFSSEWDANAQKTYFSNYGEVPFGDITTERTKSYIPHEFDVLCGGFPCQAFSIAGYRKGFEDTRGTLFFDVADIIKRHKPKAVFLENVKNLLTHDGGKTFAVIKSTLEELGYKVFYKVMNAMEYANVPQNRERIFIVGFDPQQVPGYESFRFPEPEELAAKVTDCIDYTVDDPAFFYTAKMGHFDEISKEVTDPESIYQWRRQYVRKNQSHVCPTLTANMGTGGHNVPLILTDKGIRKLTPKECLNFQGYPADFCFPAILANSAKYKQAGNSVVVPLIKKICNNIISTI